MRSIRTSVTGAVASMISSTVPPGWLNGDHTVPRGTAVVGDDRHDGGRLGAHELDVVTGGKTERIEVERVDVGGRAGGEFGQRTRLLGADGPVVEFAAHHESIVIAVPGRHGERHRRQLGRLVGEDDAVGGGFERRRRGLGECLDAAGEQVGDLGNGRHRAQRVVGGQRSVTEAQAELDGDHPVGPAGAVRRDLLGERA